MKTEEEFLKLLAELYSLEKDYKKWNINSFKDNPPRLIRLQMIHSIMQFLYNQSILEKSVLRFIEGKLIDPDQIDFVKVKQIINRYNWTETREYINNNAEVHDQPRFKMFFTWLIRYYFYLFDLNETHKSVLLANEWFLVAYKITSNISEKHEED